LTSQRGFDLPPKPGILLGLCQHNLREFFNAEVMQLLNRKHGFSGHGRTSSCKFELSHCPERTVITSIGQPKAKMLRHAQMTASAGRTAAC
jgi:hypothetical protein